MALKDAKRCNGISKTTGEQCLNPAMIGSEKCYHHGGATPRGIASPQFKTGKYSRSLPVRLAAIYEGIEADLETNLLSNNIRLREALIRQKLEMLEDAPDSQAAWDSLRSQISDLQKAFINEDYGKVQLGFENINRLIDKRNLYHLTASEIRKDLNEQRNDTNAKAAINYKGENAISINELMAFVGAMMNLISTTVSNVSERNRIFDAIERLTSTKESIAGEFTEITSIESR